MLLDRVMDNLFDTLVVPERGSVVPGLDQQSECLSMGGGYVAARQLADHPGSVRGLECP
jgi:hypothetical protein